jgi:hypothetical protein
MPLAGAGYPHVSRPLGSPWKEAPIVSWLVRLGFRAVAAVVLAVGVAAGALALVEQVPGASGDDRDGDGVTGGVAAASGPAAVLERFDPLDGAGRLVDTRPGAPTADGAQAGIGRLAPGTTVAVPVVGRLGVPAGIGAVALNVTAVAAGEPGFATVHACGIDRPPTSNLNFVEGTTRAGMVISDVGDDGAVCVYTSGAVDLVVDLVGTFEAGDVGDGAPDRLLDTRTGGAKAGAGEIVRVPTGSAADVGGVAVSVTVVHPDGPGFAAAFTCGAADRPSSTVNFITAPVIANVAIVRPDAGGDICVSVSQRTHLVVDALAVVDPAAVTVLDRPRRVLDTRPGTPVAPGVEPITGRRVGGSTTPVPVAGVGDVPLDAGAALVNVVAIDPVAPGHLTLHRGGSERPGTSSLNYAPGDVIANAAIVPLGADGELCLFTSAGSHVVIDVLGWLPTAPSTGAVGSGCPDDTSLFPGRRIVALYGNDAAAALGVLGEQPPQAAADRLRDVAAPFEQGDRPVQGAFELIATVANSFPGESGLYRTVSSDAHVQRYLDVATAEGLLLILDIQPGRGDFLTEVQRYERFLREPNVHVALDPEWHVGPGQVPGEVVGQVDATEVNAVADYLAAIVAEEGIGEKMLVVHQFQSRMLTRRELLRDPPGVAVVIHMDGFGTQSQKLATYSIVHAEPPFHNGFKLFYDEDVDMFTPAETLGLDPVPDLITYQ